MGTITSYITPVIAMATVFLILVVTHLVSIRVGE